MLYSKNKKTIDDEAKKAAIKIALFDGCPNTRFNRPLLDSGENTFTEQYPYFFEKLFNYRFNDFILSCQPISKFKGGDKAKGSLFEVKLKILDLRKDLEKNGIRNKMGI